MTIAARFLASLLLLLPATALAEPTNTPPNIVFILADDMGYGDCSANNPESKIEPRHLDRLAAEGMFRVALCHPRVYCPVRCPVRKGWPPRLRTRQERLQAHDLLGDILDAFPLRLHLMRNGFVKGRAFGEQAANALGLVALFE